ncbi:hypothetical protein MRX96_011852 [Rhipicephalus microplus]
MPGERATSVAYGSSWFGTVPTAIRWETRRPDVHWVRASTGLAVRDVPGVVTSRADGTLSFAPFRAQDYRQDLHAATYRCVASNAAGSVGSRDVQVRATPAMQPFHIHVELSERRQMRPRTWALRVDIHPTRRRLLPSRQIRSTTC